MQDAGSSSSMTRKSCTEGANTRQLRGERIKDEVYRQMFLLEESRPGAEMGLALALLRAWLTSESKTRNDEEREWLKQVSPICLEMIETALKPGDFT
jgi:hypothetical protein